MAPDAQQAVPIYLLDQTAALQGLFAQHVRQVWGCSVRP